MTMTLTFHYTICHDMDISALVKLISHHQIWVSISVAQWVYSFSLLHDQQVLGSNIAATLFS